jgi:hypothetical protein
MHVNVLGQRVLRGIFGRTVVEVRDGWNKLHNGGPQDFSPSPKLVEKSKENWIGGESRMHEK